VILNLALAPGGVGKLQSLSSLPRAVSLVLLPSLWDALRITLGAGSAARTFENVRRAGPKMGCPGRD